MALADVAGPLRLCRWWFRPTRCAWRSFLVLVVALAGVAGLLRMADGWWFRPIRCAWRSFLVVVLMADGVVVQAHSVRMAFLPCAGRGPGRRGGFVADGWVVVQAHSVRMAFLPCRCADGGWVVVQAHSVRMAFLPCLVVALARGGAVADGGWVVVQAHSVRMAFLPCAGRGPGRRGGAVADGGWVVVQAHSVRMAFLSCAGRGPGRRGGAVADGGWGGGSGPSVAWRSFLVLVVALARVAGPLRMVVDGSGPLGAHVRLLAAQRPRRGLWSDDLYRFKPIRYA